MTVLEEIMQSQERRSGDEISRRSFLSSLPILSSILLPSEAYAVRRRRRLDPCRNFRCQGEQTRNNSENYAKIPIPKVRYQPIVEETNLKGVRLANRNTDIGKIQRALRWSNITDAVSSRYGVPSKYLLSMICVESYGDPTQPNALGDGGLGLIHMQPMTATKYGLELITNSKKLRDFPQGRKIIEAIREEKADLKDLIEYDNRWHPIINIDAAARMLCDSYKGCGSWEKALCRYAGRANYPTRVIRLAQSIGNQKFMNNLKSDFNVRNRNLIIAGKPFTFDKYLEIFHQQNRNYGLDEYRKSEAHKVK